MLKSELLELTKDVADDGDVMDLLTGHEKIKGLIKPLDQFGIEDFKKLLASNKEISAYNQSSLDSAVSKGVESFKTKTMPKELEKAIKELENKGKDPVALELENLKKELARERLAGKYKDVLANEGLNSFSKYILNSDDEEVIKQNIEDFKKNVNPFVEKLVNERLGNSRHVPPKNEGGTGAITWEQVLKNPNLYAQYKQKK